MGKVEGIIKSEIVRLAKREVRKISVPLSRDVRALKSMVSQLRRSVSSIERIASRQESELGKGKIPTEVTPEEMKIARFSPRLIRSLRSRLGITQKQLAVLAGVTVGAVHQWESGKFRPKSDKKMLFIGLRKLRRRDVKKFLEEKRTQMAEKKPSTQRSKKRRGTSKRRASKR